MAHAIVTPAVRELLAEQHQLLLTVADLVDPNGALLDLQHERKTVLERGVAPLDAAGWALAAACIRLWGGCRQAPLLAEGLPAESVCHRDSSPLTPRGPRAAPGARGRRGRRRGRECGGG